MSRHYFQNPLRRERGLRHAGKETLGERIVYQAIEEETDKRRVSGCRYPGDRPATAPEQQRLSFREEIIAGAIGKRGIERGNSRGETIDEEDRLFKCSSVGR